jgi:aspartyl-tRNA(Asn)/glutamyl-tRNA(Gln) amidotransferase subunit A
MTKSRDELAFLSLGAASALVRKKEVSPVELTRACLERIAALEPRLNAFITLCEASALREAQRAEREILRRRYLGPLHGIPVALKDNIATRGIRTTGGSKILRRLYPAEDADVARALKASGAILLGKTNMNELAYGTTGENPHFGNVRNPWDTSRMPGGSSAGSAVALAAGMCFGSVGSDTGGSCRIPAGLCGIVGLKPLQADVSPRGVIDLAPSLDHVGPLARTVDDLALLFRAIARPGAGGSGPARRRSSLRSLRIGLPRPFFFERLEPEVRALVEGAVRWFGEQGATLREVQIPSLRASEKAGTDIALPEIAAYYESRGWWPRRARDFSPAVRRRLELAASVSAMDYLRAFRVQSMLRNDFAEAFERVHVLLAPTTPIPAPRFGEKAWTLAGKEETIRAALLRLCRPANLTGWPALSVPCGFTRAGLPVGLQIMAHPLGVAAALAAARAYEQAHSWRTMHPELMH